MCPKRKEISHSLHSFEMTAVVIGNGVGQARLGGSLVFLSSRGFFLCPGNPFVFRHDLNNFLFFFWTNFYIFTEIKVSRILLL